MYSLSQNAMDAFQSRPWQVEMTISLLDNSVLMVTDENIVLGTLTVDRYVSTSDAIPVGTATAAQLSFTLDNADHNFDGVQFAGASIYLVFKVSDDNNTYTLPMGYFTVDEAPRVLKTVSIVALDSMCQFDMIPEVQFPCYVYSLVRTLAEQALGGAHGDVIYDDANITSLPNANYQILVAPEKIEEMTARQLLQYCCQIMGVNAQINRGNRLYLAKYLTTSLATIDEHKRYSSDIREEISVTGVSITNVNGDTDMIGTEGYVLEIKDNPLIQTDPSELKTDLNYLRSVSFCPYSAVVMPMPWMFPMDFMTFTKEETNYPIYITKLTQTVNANTALEGTGLSVVRKGYATIDPLTAREQQILRDIRTRAAEQVTKAEQSAINFSTIIGNALGLYNTQIVEGGATYYYFHDQETLDDSTVIYTFTAQGFGIATHWGGSHSGTTWQWGVSQMGASTSAIFTYLNAHQITADQIDVSTIHSNAITVSTDDNGNHVFGNSTVEKIIGDEMDSTIKSADASAETLKDYANQLFIGDLHDVLPSVYTSANKTFGVVIGKKSESNFIPSAIFAPSKLSFCDTGGNEVAWISSAQLHINDAEIMSSMKMGGFRWVIESDGELILRWVGVNN